MLPWMPLGTSIGRCWLPSLLVSSSVRTLQPLSQLRAPYLALPAAHKVMSEKTKLVQFSMAHSCSQYRHKGKSGALLLFCSSGRQYSGDMLMTPICPNQLANRHLLRQPLFASQSNQTHQGKEQLHQRP